MEEREFKNLLSLKRRLVGVEGLLGLGYILFTVSKSPFPKLPKCRFLKIVAKIKESFAILFS